MPYRTAGLIHLRNLFSEPLVEVEGCNFETLSFRKSLAVLIAGKGGKACRFLVTLPVFESVAVSVRLDRLLIGKRESYRKGQRQR